MRSLTCYAVNDNGEVISGEYCNAQYENDLVWYNIGGKLYDNCFTFRHQAEDVARAWRIEASL